MNETEKEPVELVQVKDFVKDGRFDDAANIIALYIGDAKEDNFLDRLENVIETLLTLHGGRTVLRLVHHSCPKSDIGLKWICRL